MNNKCSPSQERSWAIRNSSSRRALEGLSPLIVSEIFHLIQNLKKNEGVTILIAEQNMKFCMKVADWGYLIEKGIIKHSASMESINSDSEIQMKFLAL